jgi:polar amino acid transport system substrate-binding protein
MAGSAALVAGVLLLGAGRQIVVRAQPVPPVHAARSVWDSVYSAQQATRGDSIYKAACAECHGPTLGGKANSQDAPALIGAAFLSNWNGQTLADLYARLQEMPPDDPKPYDAQTITDAIAYLLQQNKFPAGAKELVPDVAAQKDIKIESSKP